MIKKIILVGAATVAIASMALAQDNSPWDLKERMGYVVDMSGKMKIMSVSDKGMTMLMAKAKPVPHGTVIFMNKGQLYMVNEGAFDKGGAWMAGGS